MYFRNYGYRKSWLGKCLKSPVSDEFSAGNIVNGLGPNTVAFWTAAPSPYLLITVKVIELEKVSFSAMQSLKSFC